MPPAPHSRRPRPATTRTGPTPALPTPQAALSRGKLLLTTRADITDDGGLYTPRPGVIWAEIAPQITYADATGDAGGAPFTVAAAECPAAVANGMAATFDWSKDYSLTWWVLWRVLQYTQVALAAQRFAMQSVVARCFERPICALGQQARMRMMRVEGAEEQVPDECKPCHVHATSPLCPQGL